MLSPSPSLASSLPRLRTARDDPRWPRLCAALARLRARRRHAVRIVDADCGAGSLLLRAVQHARTLGFTAIEARGIAGSPALIGRARAAASRTIDPAIGLDFTSADLILSLREEAEMPADIVLWRGPCDGPTERALWRAAAVLIAQPPVPHLRRAA